MQDLANENGIIAFFKEMNAYKKSSEILKSGDFSELYSGRNVYAFKRQLDGKSLVAVFNFSEKYQKMPKDVCGKRVISNYKGAEKKLRPYEFVLFEA